MRKIAICGFLLLALPFAGSAFAQDAPAASAASKAPQAAKAPEPPVHYYHIDLVVQELGDDGKPVNSRTYSTTIDTDPRSNPISIRTGSKIPIATGSSSNGGQVQNTQFQYVDVGVNFDIDGGGRTKEVGDRLAFFLSADISSLASSVHMGGPGGSEEPVMRQNRWHAPVLVPIGKATVVFTSEALDSKGGMQVVVTATRLE